MNIIEITGLLVYLSVPAIVVLAIAYRFVILWFTDLDAQDVEND